MYWIFGVAVAAVVAFFLVAERGHLLRRSTRRFFREAGFNLEAIHGYVYGRWTRQYVHILLNPPGAPGDGAKSWLAERYHGKVLTHDNARSIVTNDRRIPLQDLEQIIPFPVARKLVLDGPPEVVAYECACRNNRPHHCEPTQVCMVIGQPMADFVLEHHPKTSRRLSQAEALELLEAERARGHVHCAWFKDALMGRFYAICNCCKCCCGGIETMRNWGTKMIAASGYVARWNAEACGHCEDCRDTCPFGALAAREGAIALDWDRCMGCGVCEALCPSGAMTLVRDERKGIPLDVRALPA